MKVLFETSWEVCNKVGGIYTVISSKAKYPQNHFDKYFCVGPWLNNSPSDFQEETVPNELQPIFQKLREQNIHCHYGIWLVPGNPEAILIDFQSLFEKSNQIKTDLWNNFKVDSLVSGFEFDEPLVWSTAVGKFVEEYYNQTKDKQPDIILHSHEWMAGTSLLYIKTKKIPIATVFTTHATILGRTLSSNYRDLYGELTQLNPEEEARHHNMIDKHSIEVACAKASDTFTTVSEITAKEATYLLHRKPDVLTINGLDETNFPDENTMSEKHRKSKEMLKQFFTKYFFPYYTFDLDKTSIVFTSGRYEFHDKGTGTFIHALKDLNDRLIEKNIDKTVIAMLTIPSKSYELKKEIPTDHITHSLEGTPPICSHYLENEENDQIIKAIRATGLNNSKDQKVKIVFIPKYLEKNDGLFNVDYYDVIAGGHLGVFASVYEPWGYTPLECSFLGIPSITTNLSGYGQYVEQFLSHDLSDGVFVLDSNKEIVKQIAGNMFNFINRSKEERQHNKVHAKEIAKNADWKHFYTFYLNSYDLALKRLKHEET